MGYRCRHGPAGDVVVCDDCNKDYTGSAETGGILFGSRALGPCCAPKWEAGAKEYDEEHFITMRCPEGKPFCRWVIEDVCGGELRIIGVGGL